MKVIVILGKKMDKKAYLILELPDEEIIKEVKELVNSWNCAKAMASVIANGKLIKALTEKDITYEPSDLILTRTNAYWSLI